MDILICDGQAADAKLLRQIFLDRGHRASAVSNVSETMWHCMLKSVMVLIVDPQGWRDEDLNQLGALKVPRKAFWTLLTVDAKTQLRCQVERLFNKATEIGRLLDWIDEMSRIPKPVSHTLQANQPLGANTRLSLFRVRGSEVESRTGIWMMAVIASGVADARCNWQGRDEIGIVPSVGL